MAYRGIFRPVEPSKAPAAHPFAAYRSLTWRRAPALFAWLAILRHLFLFPGPRDDRMCALFSRSPGFYSHADQAFYLRAFAWLICRDCRASRFRARLRVRRFCRHPTDVRCFRRALARRTPQGKSGIGVPMASGRRWRPKIPRHKPTVAAIQETMRAIFTVSLHPIIWFASFCFTPHTSAPEQVIAPPKIKVAARP